MEIRTRFTVNALQPLSQSDIWLAMLNEVFAKYFNGKFFIRIDDNFAPPHVAVHVANQTKELGLNFDLAQVLQGLPGHVLPADQAMILDDRKSLFKSLSIPGFVHQSLRHHSYVNFACDLERQGAAYKCFCSSRERNPKKCLTDLKARVAWQATGKRWRVRLDTAKIVDEFVSFDDELLGEVSRSGKDIGDLVIVGRSGAPTYWFMGVVDDIEMGITHIINRQSQIIKSHSQALVYKALNIKRPKYLHIHLKHCQGDKSQWKTSVQEYFLRELLPLLWRSVKKTPAAI